MAELKPMPRIGFGLWKIAPEDCKSVVGKALETGYRHFDSACDYGNEKEVGQALSAGLKDGVCTRQDLWITSKLWNTYHRPEHVQPALEKALSDLQTDYLDLYLIHFPISLKFVPFEKRYPPEWIYDEDSDNPVMVADPVPLKQTWAAMEDLVRKGVVKHIGVCNYNSGLLHDLMAYSEIKPAMLQVEMHPFHTQERLLKLARSYGMDVTAYSPLGAMSYVPIDMAEEKETVLNQKLVRDIAQRHGKTAAQVVLKWGLQRGTAIIPKTVTPERMVENISLEDFTLSDEEMSAISGLNLNRRFNDPGYFTEKAFGTFYPIYD